MVRGLQFMASRHLPARPANDQLELVAVDVEQAHLARQAFRNFGKGRHPAGLNFGDCFSYALARSVAEALLYKGVDFGSCDIESHPASC